MICPECHGTGRYKSPLPVPVGHGFTLSVDGPCTTCWGSGIVHCCDGDQAYPEPEDKDA